MGAMGATVGDTFTPRQKVPQSGIYDVLHDAAHAQQHQVICVYGELFPPCRTCKYDVKFRLAIAAIHVKDHAQFK
jgi:hypothetical protein